MLNYYKDVRNFKKKTPISIPKTKNIKKKQNAMFICKANVHIVRDVTIRFVADNHFRVVSPFFIEITSTKVWFQRKNPLGLLISLKPGTTV